MRRSEQLQAFEEEYSSQQKYLSTPATPKPLLMPRSNACLLPTITNPHQSQWEYLAMAYPPAGYASQYADPPRMPQLMSQQSNTLPVNRILIGTTVPGEMLTSLNTQPRTVDPMEQIAQKVSEIAACLEKLSMHQGESNSPPNRSRRNRPGPSSPCRICNCPGHWKKNCRNRQVVRPKAQVQAPTAPVAIGHASLEVVPAPPVPANNSPIHMFSWSVLEDSDSVEAPPSMRT